MTNTTTPKRRSKYVTTLLMGAAAVSMVACDNAQDVNVNVYRGVDACAQENDASICEQEYKNAEAQHINSAPKFASAQECADAGFDQCQAVPPQTPIPGQEGAPQQTASSTGGGMFMPMLMGYMMGRTLGGMGAGAAGGPNMTGAPARPVYADRNGFVYSGNREVSRLAPGQTLASAGTTTMRTRMSPTGDLAGRTVSRGGFGATGSRFSSGGGS